MIVAIDGPCASGKGTIASILSKRLNLVNIDTGATYRCIALKCINEKINIDEEDKIVEISNNIDIKFDENNNVFLDGVDVTSRIRDVDVTQIVSPISSIIKLRENMVNLQRKLAENKNVIMEGRDITTVVVPNADFKFYLDANLETRAKRRYEQNKDKSTYEEVLESIKKRDYNDTHKKVGALTRTKDQIYIDTTNLTIDEVAKKIENVIKGSV